MSRSRSRRRNRGSAESDSSSSSSPERDPEDYLSIMEHENDSQSSLGVSITMEDMDLDADSAHLREQHRISPISRLPAELLISIFRQMQNNPKDLQRCVLVSRSWARNCVDLLWHRPSTDSWKRLMKVMDTARIRNGFFAYHDLIKRLNLSHLNEQISDGVLFTLAECKRIERLTLTNCTKITDTGLAGLIQGNRSLLALDVTGLESITDKSLLAVANNCYRLQGLNITGCRKVTDTSLFQIAKNCRRVKRLKLNECSQLTDYSVMAFADFCHELLEVDLHKCRNLTDASVTSVITNGQHLRELRLAQCTRITDDAFLKLPSDQHFESLRILDLTDCMELQDAGLAKIVQAAPRLRNLVLAKCRNITDRGVFAITRLGKNLHYIHLGHCARITDYGLTQLIRLCNRIRYIDLACCHSLTDDSVSLLATLPKLKRIGLVKCGSITDASIIALARHKPHHGYHQSSNVNSLERVHLSYCTLLTIRGVRSLLLNCPRLTHLSLTGVQEFIREDLLVFCRAPPSEFTDHQRGVFCVFSGDGVLRLREHLRMLSATEHPPPPPPPPPPPHGVPPHQQPFAPNIHQSLALPHLHNALQTQPGGPDPPLNGNAAVYMNPNAMHTWNGYVHIDQLQPPPQFHGNAWQPGMPYPGLPVQGHNAADMHGAQGAGPAMPPPLPVGVDVLPDDVEDEELGDESDLPGGD